MLDGIVHLARSYDAIMEEQGQPGHPITIPHDDTKEGRVEPSGMPSVSDIEGVMKETTQPQGSVAEVRMRMHDKSLPLSSDGLVNKDYVLASGVPIIQDLITTDQYIKTYELRFQAIREVLSRIPEDTWNGANIASLVERTYQELVNGRGGYK